jgi:CcmD family protein
MSPEELKRNFQFMFYGFSAAWLVLAVYAVYLLRRARHIAIQMDSLRLLVQRERPKVI